MTGFGQGVASGDHFQWTVSLRGVNHRFLDILLRWRDELPALESTLRGLLEEQLFRGRVEVTIEAIVLGETTNEVQLDESLVATLKEAVVRLAGEGTLSSDRFEVRDLLRVPGAVQVRSVQVEASAEDEQALMHAAQQALQQFVAARELEGRKIQDVLSQRLQSLQGVVQSCRELRQGATETHFEALRQKLEEWAGTVTDEARLAQEAALLVDRGDVSEELDRLTSHLEHWHEVIDQPGSLGKRLDFLAQEILRELNTIASKCRDSDMTRAVVDGKVLCEQLREQVQNVE